MPLQGYYLFCYCLFCCFSFQAIDFFQCFILLLFAVSSAGDSYGRRWMVGNYLDGRHLQVLALKGDDGKIYLYRADEESFSKSRALCPDYRERIEAFIAEAKEATAEYRRSGYYNAIWKSTLKKRDAFNNGIGRQYQQLRALEVTKIINRVEIFTDKSDLPPIRYRVEFTLLPETFLINSLICAAARRSPFPLDIWHTPGLNISVILRRLIINWGMNNHTI